MLRLYSSKASNLKTIMKAMMPTAINAMKTGSANIMAGQDIIRISNIKTCILRYTTIFTELKDYGCLKLLDKNDEKVIKLRAHYSS